MPSATPPAPRLLSAAQAAAYLSLPKAEVARLALGAVRLGRRVLYDRVAIDRELDARGGLAPPSPPPALTADNDDPEAAFERSAPDLGDAARRP
jgi:hypothetical protein